MTRLAVALRSIAGPLAGLGLVLVLFTVLDPNVPGAFFTVQNVRTALAQHAGLIVCAVGMTFVIRSGGIDLSIGSVVALSSVIMARALRDGHPGPLAIGAAILTGVMIGLLNAQLIVGLRLSPFIATLGTFGMARGVAKWAAGDQTVRFGPLPDWMAWITSKSPTPPFLLVAPSVWLALAVALAAAVVLRNSIFGIHVQAIGSNEANARLCGVPVGWTKYRVYAISGGCAGLAGALLCLRLGLGDPTGAVGDELRTVAAVVIGGASLAGGEGSIAGSLVGVLSLAVLASGANVLGIPNSLQEIITGGLIVVAVAIDAWRHRRR
jgi:ribose transport system permease protein